MAIIKITLTDTENGRVKVDADPDVQLLVRKRRDDALTPAEGYAYIALASVMKTSIKEAQDKMKAKKLGNGIIYPDRFKLQ